MQTQEVMTPQVTSLDAKAPVQQAAMVMASENVGAVPVTDQGRLIGMVSDRDITVRVVAQQKDPASTCVGDAMSNDFHYCLVADDCREVARTMAQLQVLRLPVVNREKELVGMVHAGDLTTRAGNDEASPVAAASSKLDEALEDTFPASDPISPP